MSWVRKCPKRRFQKRYAVYVRSAEGDRPAVPAALARAIKDGTAFEPGGPLSAKRSAETKHAVAPTTTPPHSSGSPW